MLIVGTYRPTDSPRFRLRGTGFVVAGGNHAITNAHVLPESTENTERMTLAVQVRSAGQDLSMRTATVLEVDRVHDLALLRFDGPPVPALTLRDSRWCAKGWGPVAFIGLPHRQPAGFLTGDHRGIVSSITPAVMPAPTSPAAQRGVDPWHPVRQLRHLPARCHGVPWQQRRAAVRSRYRRSGRVVNMVLLKNAREGALSQPSASATRCRRTSSDHCWSALACADRRSCRRPPLSPSGSGWRFPGLHASRPRSGALTNLRQARSGSASVKP